MKKTTTVLSTKKTNIMPYIKRLPRLLFVIGCPRSGTTGISWAIGSHPLFHVSSESDLLWELYGKNNHLKNVYSKLIERWTVEQHHSIVTRHDIEYDVLLGYIGFGFHLMTSHITQGKRHIDHAPANTLFAEDLYHLFPTAQFIHIVRDGRYVVNSMINFVANPYWKNNFKQACLDWKVFASSGNDFVRKHPENSIEIKLEDVVEDPYMVFSQIQDFVNVDRSDVMAVHFIQNRINSSYGLQTRKGYKLHTKEELIPKNPSENWTSKQKRMFANICEPLALKLGYQVDL